MLIVLSRTSLIASPPFYYFSSPPGAGVGQCTFDHQQAGLLGGIEQVPVGGGPGGPFPETYFPFLIEEASAEDLNNQLIEGACMAVAGL